MAWYTFWRRWVRRPVAPPVAVRALPRGRTSIDALDNYTTASWVLVPPANYEANWQLMTLSGRDLEYLQPTKLLELLADLSPEISRALWDFLRMCNPGYTVTARRVGSDQPDTRAQAAVQAFLDRLADQHGTVDIVIGRLFLGAFLRGALCAELVLDKRGRLPLDVATPDPGSIRFRRRTDPERGDIWQPGQWQAGRFVALDLPTVRYVPIDPLPNSPYGRPLAAPALYTTLFLLGILHDLRRVIQQQGYPRLDISVDVAQILEAAPHLAADTTAFYKFVQDVVAQVETAYSQLQPDDAYIHTSNVTVNQPVGAVGADSLGGIDSVITALERMAARALKTMPLMLGITEAIGDVQSNRQYEIFAAGIKSIQHYTETLLERLLGLALEAQGIQASIEFRFAELRAAEMLRDAQTEAMRIANANAKYQAGWISQDAASVEITGSPAVSPTPLAPPTALDLVQDDGDGNEQARWLEELRLGRAAVTRALEAIQRNGYH